MSIIFNTEKRRIIPRWRSFEISSLTGELSLVSDKSQKLPFLSANYLIEQKAAWESNKDITHASDLLSSAFVLGVEKEFPDAARLILAREDRADAPILKLAHRALGLHINDNQVVAVKDEESKDFEFNEENYRPAIKKYRWYLKREPRNPLAYLELGRLYTLVGEIEKAKRCIDAALYLDKDSRFIVRSASRFYHHEGKEAERALHIIKSSEFVKKDPWLISAEIAYSSILGRHSRMAKLGVEMLKNYEENSLSITELASALGTLELTDGSLKNSRKYFKQALIEPNDNSLAQVGWMLKSVGQDALDINKFNNVPLAFEALAQNYYNQNKFQESLDSALEWFADEPYSTRPIKLASSLTGIFFNDRKRSIKLLEQGLKMNPKDVMLTNNMVYYLALENKIDKAIELFDENLKEHLDEVDKLDTISVIATFVLLYYRRGLQEKGKESYLKAIALAKAAKNTYLEALATVNYVREELQYTQEPQTLLKQLDAACKNRTEADVKTLYTRLINDYEQFRILKKQV